RSLLLPAERACCFNSWRRLGLARSSFFTWSMVPQLRVWADALNVPMLKRSRRESNLVRMGVLGLFFKKEAGNCFYMQEFRNLELGKVVWYSIKRVAPF